MLRHCTLLLAAAVTGVVTAAQDDSHGLLRDDDIHLSTASDVSHLHLPANTTVGSIVKAFPAAQLRGLSLLPSRDAGSFYLLNSGQLMLADNLASKAGTYT